jgi:hypothetical protein
MGETSVISSTIFRICFDLADLPHIGDMLIDRISHHESVYYDFVNINIVFGQELSLQQQLASENFADTSRSLKIRQFISLFNDVDTRAHKPLKRRSANIDLQCMRKV